MPQTLLLTGILWCGRAGAVPGIVGGTTDTGDNAVAEVLINHPNHTASLCSGTLIAPNLLLTAGHCAVADITCNSPGNPAACQPGSAGQYRILGGTSPLALTPKRLVITDPAWTASVTAVHPDPGFGSGWKGGSADYVNDPHDDAAVLELGPIQVSPGGTMPTPLPWLSHPDPQAYLPGAQVHTVGYGITQAGTRDGVGTKRSIDWEIENDQAPGFNASAKGKNICSGDSGGPTIEVLQGVPTVVGISSDADTGCSQYGGIARTDLAAPFIARYAAAAEAARIQACAHARAEVGQGLALAVADGLFSSTDAFPFRSPELVSGLQLMQDGEAQEAGYQCSEPANSPGPGQTSGPGRAGRFADFFRALSSPGDGSACAQ